MLYGRLNMFVMKSNNSANSGNYSTSLYYPITGDNYWSIRIIIKKWNKQYLYHLGYTNNEFDHFEGECYIGD